jgi:small subunit ribosomal protein S20
MPNTKSAERRMRNSARKQTQNRSAKSRLKTLERAFLDTVKSGKREDAVQAYQAVSSGFDKAAKNGVIHSGTADRKKSRLSHRLASLATASAK